jgi:Siphovirus ReqiPepy6 Gp37-like protein
MVKVVETQPKLQINIYDQKDLTWKAMLDSAISLTHRSSWNEIVNSEMRISKKAQNIQEVQVGRVVVINNQRDKALIIEEMTTNLMDEFWTITMIPLKAILNYRICHPTDTTPFVGRSQAAVMMIIPFNNLVSQTRDPDRKFWDSTGTKNRFGVVALVDKGDTIDFTVDWNTGYMGDTIVDLSKMHGVGKYPIGWNIFIPPTWDAYHMETYSATNRSVNQTVNNRVVFSEEYGNIVDATYTYSIKDWRNVAYVKWNNGTTDQNTPVGNTTRGATIGFNRKEIIIDSSKKNSTEVTNEGRSELNKRPHIESFTAEILHNPNTMSTYGEHWNLGDIVTIQSKNLKENVLISIDAQITQIEEIYDNGLYSINATFGEARLTLIDLIKNSIKSRRVSIYSAALVPIILSVVQAFKMTGWVQDKYAPFLSIAVGIGISFLLVHEAFDNLSSVILGGILFGLSASGLYSGITTTAAAIKADRQKKEQKKYEREMKKQQQQQPNQDPNKC